MQMGDYHERQIQMNKISCEVPDVRFDDFPWPPPPLSCDIPMSTDLPTVFVSFVQVLRTLEFL